MREQERLLDLLVSVSPMGVVMLDLDGRVQSMNLIAIAISSCLVSNVVLSQFLGICSFVGVSNRIKTSFSLGMAVIFVITIASAVANLLYTLILEPFGLDYLQTIVFILVIAALVQLVEMFLKKTSPALYQALGIFLPLITTNCAVLGVALNNVTDGYNFIESVINGFGTAVGYTIAIFGFSTLTLG